MVISHEYRFIFLKTYKTGGTSVEVHLSKVCGEGDVLTPIWPHVETHRARHHKGLWNPFPELLDRTDRHTARKLVDLARADRFYNHIPATTLRHRVPRRIWNSYFKFCVERNPWDKTLSHYWMVRERTGGSMSFAEYLGRGDFCQNHPIYCDRDGGLMVDQVLRYESMSEDMGKVFARLGVPFDGSFGVQAKGEHRKDRAPYRERFLPDQRDIVARAFSREIAMHGYAF